MESKNYSNSDFDILLEKMNKDLFNKELSDIVEVTYAYSDLWNWNFFNKTLFWTLLWIDFYWKEKNEEKNFWKNISWNISELFIQTELKLLEKKDLVIKYKESLQLFLKENNPRTQILLWTLEYILNILDLTITWLPFEAEKAWLNHNLSSNEISKRVISLENIETKLFWWKVSENEYEVRGSYEFLLELFQKQKKILNQEEQENFLWYLDTIKNSFNYLQDVNNLPNEKYKTESLKLLDRNISRENYIKIFKLIFQIYDLKKDIIVEERSSIYDWADYLWIPDSDSYKNLTIKRILELIQHEIETHYIIEDNNSKTLWKFRWWDNLPREEWLAMSAEWILKWNNLEDIKVSWSIPDILMWEILSWEEYKKFLILLSKLKSTKNSNWIFLRRKRNYPLNYNWVQHKDTTYNRWQHKILNFISSWSDIKDLYVWKVSFDDIPKTKEIIKIENIKIIYPLLIWELLKYVILNNSLIEKDFWEYIEQKYPFLNIKQEISDKSIKRLTFFMKRKVVQILNLFNN